MNNKPHLTEVELTNLFHTARQHHQKGQLTQAEVLYRRILQIAPHHPQTLHLLGVLAHQTEHHAQAAHLIQQAINHNKKVPAFYNNLGNALRALGDIEEAKVAYQTALELNPNYVGACCNLAHLYRDLRQPELARRYYQQALTLNPNWIEAHLGLGQLWQRRGNFSQAETCYRTALEQQPHHAEAHFELGSLYRQQGHIPAAIKHFQAAVQHNPNFATAYNNLGATLHLQGNIEAAARCFQRTLALTPNNAEAHFNLGTALATENNFSEAIQHYEHALAQEPPFATQIFYYLTEAYLKLADWSDYKARLAELIRRTEAHLERDDPIPLPLLSLNVLPLSGDFRLAIAKQQARRIHQTVQVAKKSTSFHHHTSQTEHPQRLRIGYVSPDFRQHAVGYLIAPLLAGHDRTAFETYAYSLFETQDPLQRQIQADCDHYRNIASLSPLAAAQQIYEDGIHILIDLAGHTTFSRPAIFALEPAPVQAHYLGYLDTMGATFLPNIIADPYVITPEMAEHYTEAIIRLPHAFTIAPPQPIASNPPKRQDYGLPETDFVFCCFNRLHKIDPQVFATWLQILNQVPHSVLWLSGSKADPGVKNLQQTAQASSISPQRLIFAPHEPLPTYLARYQLADLFLDTFVYNAGATALGALRAGLPILTRPGQTYLSRMGSSFNRAAGLPELICDDATAYIDRAVYFATHPTELTTLRQRLIANQQTQPLFNTKLFVHHLEEAYHQLWATYCAGKPPHNIDIFAKIS